MKKFVLYLMILSLIFSFSFPVFSEEESPFIISKIPYPEGESLWNESYEKYSSVLLRYADDKTPIPLSAYYNKYVYATIPRENKDRPLEVFISKGVEFTDKTDAFEFYIMDKASKRGIVMGDEDKRAYPFSDVTRAEALAMILRLIGISEDCAPVSHFEDVSLDSWYHDIVSVAFEKGIVTGDSETIFSPERKVSREEMITMAARATYYTGLKRENKDTKKEDILTAFSLQDGDKISPYAISAYDTLKTFVPMDCQETDELDSEGIPKTITFVNPKKNATRFEIADIILRICENFQVYPSTYAEEYGFDKKMPVMDGSTSTYPFTEAIYRNLFFCGYYHKDKPLSHSKSFESYNKLINGEIDLMIASVYPSEEVLSIAEEKGVKLELIPIGYDAMIFFTNKNNQTNSLTKEQITDIYVNNKYKKWSELGGDDALIYPYARNYTSGSHAQMEKHFLKGEEIHHTIRNETTSVTMANILTDVMGAETESPKGYALGYSIYYYFHNMDLFYDTDKNLKLLSIDGVYPTDETIQDGSYPLSNHTYIVLRKDSEEGSPERLMADFMLTELGQTCVEEAGFGPLKK